MSDAPIAAEAELAEMLISVAAHVEGELEEALAEHGLTRPSYLVLDALGRAADHTLNQRELVARLRRTSGTLSVRLGRLERARLIVRKPDPGNRRSVTVTLTPRGAALARAARPTYEARAAHLADGIPGDGAGVLAGALGGWLTFFEPAADGEAPRLGVAVAGPAVARRMRRAVGLPDVPGVLIVRAGTDSPAARAGLGRGDLITAAGGASVASIGDLERAVGAAAGQALTLTVLRGTEARELRVTPAGPSTESVQPVQSTDAD